MSHSGRAHGQHWVAAIGVAALVVLQPAALFAASADGGDSWMPTLAKLFNFSLLVGLLVYFLRGIVSGYLRTRHATIRKDLVDAAALRASAEQQLTGVRERLSVLPAELDALKKLGQEELAEERVRMKDATARAREQLLDRARRDIGLRFRLARRALTEHTADLAVRLARTRIEQAMTAEDQVRLIDRYTSEVRS